MSRAKKRLEYVIKRAVDLSDEGVNDLDKVTPPAKNKTTRKVKNDTVAAHGDTALTAYSKVASQLAASATRKVIPVLMDPTVSPQSSYNAALPTPGDLLLGIAGLHPDYAKFLAKSDPRLAAILLKLKERAKRRG